MARLGPFSSFDSPAVIRLMECHKACAGPGGAADNGRAALHGA